MNTPPTILGVWPSFTLLLACELNSSTVSFGHIVPCTYELDSEVCQSVNYEWKPACFSLSLAVCVLQSSTVSFIDFVRMPQNILGCFIPTPSRSNSEIKEGTQNVLQDELNGK